MHLTSLRLVGVAAALIIRPLVAADEPFANLDPPSSTVSSATDAAPAAADPAPVVGPAPTPSSSESEPGVVEHSLYDSLFMAGKTQDQFHPFTPKERLKAYSKDLFSPFHILVAGVQSGITQWQNEPPEWGQGALGYGRRFANYYAYDTTSNMMQMIGEDILHEDNFYYGSGEHGLWRRTKYAIKSSVLARGADGTQHFSISQVGSTAGAAFVSRLWQPRSSNLASDGAKSFVFALGTNALVNVLREFLPDGARYVFRHGQESQR